MVTSRCYSHPEVSTATSQSDNSCNLKAKTDLDQKEEVWEYTVHFFSPSFFVCECGTNLVSRLCLVQEQQIASVESVPNQTSLTIVSLVLTRVCFQLTEVCIPSQEGLLFVQSKFIHLFVLCATISSRNRSLKTSVVVGVLLLAGGSCLDMCCVQELSESRPAHNIKRKDLWMLCNPWGWGRLSNTDFLAQILVFCFFFSVGEFWRKDGYNIGVEVKKIAGDRTRQTEIYILTLEQPKKSGLNDCHRTKDTFPVIENRE